ncbi:MAG TPA: FtsX-like permease family protein [Candidatus Babeliales bacterium]|jgi:lipoprotein-releasing system permease protein|nr:FtsX-like permease family protein [Candidatus Babeliales bacterium]
MNMTAFFLAQRILFTHIYQKSISTMTIICFIGIFIGSFSLALVTAIMNGFEVVIHEKMQGIHSNLIIQSYKNDININVLTKVLHKEFPEITAFSPMATHHILLRTKSESDDIPTVAMIKGIDPKTEINTSSLSQKIINPSSSIQFDQLFNNNQIIIGKQLARNNTIAIGDQIELLFMRDGHVHGKKIIVDSQPAVVSGIFDTGIDEFDNGVVYCSLSFLEKLFPNIAIEQINVTLSPNANEQAIIKKLRKRLMLDVYSWKDLYPSLVATLKLEKYVSFFILALILLVASMNIISLLFMQITQKRPDIAVLKAMGMSHNAISTIFFIIGMTISCVASFFGLITAIIASLLLQRYPFITLPDSYYVTQLPVAMNGEIVCAVFCVVIIFSLFATWLPIQRIRAINISHVLRFEG